MHTSNGDIACCGGQPQQREDDTYMYAMMTTPTMSAVDTV